MVIRRQAAISSPVFLDVVGVFIASKDSLGQQLMEFYPRTIRKAEAIPKVEASFLGRLGIR